MNYENEGDSHWWNNASMYIHVIGVSFVFAWYDRKIEQNHREARLQHVRLSHNSIQIQCKRLCYISSSFVTSCVYDNYSNYLETRREGGGNLHAPPT